MHRLSIFLRVNDDRVALNDGLSRDKLAVPSRDLELNQRFTIARLQPAANLGE
jgi:hypothetical protein